MFYTIFKQELKYWFNKPAFYIYTAIFLLLSLFIAASTAGIFDSITVTTGSSRIVNSPMGVTGLFSALTVFIFFLFPSIIGVSIHRDFKSEMHTILYSYPFTKSNYLFAKFLSSILIVTLIVLVIGIGIIIGFRLPGTNSELLTDFNIISYLKTYLIFILPNVLFFGAIVFAVVTFSRNIAAGFITVILILFVQGVIESILSEPEQAGIAAILDPFGGAAVNYYTKYWTVSEQNELQIPIKEMIMYNRLLWVAISSLIFGLVYRFFTFSQHAFSFSFSKKASKSVRKNNVSGITRIKLPKVTNNYSFIQHLKTTWTLSTIDFKYIFKSLPFLSIIIVGVLLIVFTLFNYGQLFGTETLPLTWQMLQGGSVFKLSINICTFLYAGMLVHRARMNKTNHLIDVTPIPNWVLLVSKLIALLKMQLLLLAVILVSGIIFQTYKGFYNYEIGHYLYELYILNFLNYVVWALLAIFVQTLFKNPYVGVFILLVISISIPFLSFAGVEQAIFKYNEGPKYSYSDMNGYGSFLMPYLTYKTYWMLGGLVLLVLSFMFWVRGIPNSFAERFQFARARFKGFSMIFLILFLVAFLSLGYSIYQETGTKSNRTSSKEMELRRVEWEKKYKQYEDYVQPRIIGVKTEMHIFPKERNFKASGVYTMVNKTSEAIDSVFVNHNNLESSFNFNKPVSLVSEDTIHHFDIYYFEQKILPGDTLELAFTVKNKKNTAYRVNSSVRENGTFISNVELFPTLGYSSQSELTDDKTRKKHSLPPNNLRPQPTDSTALANTYISKDSDWIDFEATVSTSEDQIAIAPGYLQKEWTKDGRRYFHYKMDAKILNFYAFNSARYEVKKEVYKGVSLEIYYHKAHLYNLDRMMKGLKASLDYNSSNFSPYQHKQLRIVEFPRNCRKLCPILF